MKRLIPAALALATLTTGFATGAPAHAGSAPSAFIRVDQVGFAPAETKHAYLMTSGAAGRFSVVDRRGREVLTGTAGRDLGAWNTRYPHVYDLDLTRLRTPGSYRIKAGAVTSPEFEVAPAGLLDAPARKVVDFFGLQRDGVGARGGPSHLNDRAASVYAWPEFTGPDTDQIKGGLTRIGGPVDVEGGWFDAGDYLKFTHILSYVDTLLWAAERDGAPVPRLRAEAAHGLGYLDKMWDEKTKTLYIQVGIGAGNEAGTFDGDHDIWRLPQADDGDTGDGRQFIRHRPVFRAAAPGEPISPNLAGRTAAAFALAAQLEPSRERAKELLDKAASVYAMAKTTGVGQLVTSLPHAFYPESVWRDDMELGGAQLALAAQRLGDPRAGRWLAQAAHWAAEYLREETGDTLNLYDVSALAHADLVRAIRRARASGLAVSEADLVAGLRVQLEIGARRAAADPFRAGARYDEFDSVPHAFGLAATSRLYRSVTGDRSYDAFGTGQRSWALGANPWGVSFVAEVGENSIACPHHQVANITGRPATGAVVNGPNSAELFEDGLGGRFDEMPACPPDEVDRYEEFTGRGSRFVDDVRSWQASEPADDFAAVALYALTLMSR
ncbi:glycoside hydrolase family 9 protein [Nonomuraea jiangxiensis]|uniref:N-terminal ig-like domain of cellulase n=1 Tax=Nonomuraea jiangxiensis TaxID=633440 RepID=A0A1G8PZJ5_9ACTN|nr:glycoside hydrolase family 9 protein [Nonomuraea jiangxiensis]SDI97912.1 N-terminal ig-like domain of cellulase [Nonomuraea jiangxiensis]